MLYLIVFLCIMGFVLAFIHNLFEQDELPIKRAMIIIFLTGGVSVLMQIMMLQNEVPHLTIYLAGLVVSFSVMTLLLKGMAYTTMPKAALMALIYAVIKFGYDVAKGYLLTP